ncbi:UvrD-helicase domain-containing protein [Serinicoccus marinus]|uniref:UvrD-helicase domain-containing protein n=1 Tax=Serinicoccus marinus TaxID=247333 RepID=UPI002490B035|nr:UvrD-helicase domain-containing protein [Serinicoccus marinus]
MPTIIWSKTKAKDKLAPSMKKKGYAFLEKLAENDTQPGLHIEEIRGSKDKRVRTGKVDDNFRAVLFKIEGGEEAVYVIHGIWSHDKANSIAEKVTLDINPVNGVPEIREVMDTLKDAAGQAPQPAKPAPVLEQWEHAPAGLDGDSEPGPTWSFAHDPVALNEQLGVDRDLADAAAAVQNEHEFLAVVDAAAVDWQGLALLELATGRSFDEVKDTFALDTPVDTSGTEDERLLRSLRDHPAARASFTWIEDNEELRRIIDAGDLGAWRLFLHPAQRHYVERDYNGAFRLSGGAGTGKTVVAVHRARRLAVEDPGARVLFTTYTRNLADDLRTQVGRLDDSVALPSTLDTPGVYVSGIDALARAVVQRAGRSIEDASVEVLGRSGAGVLRGTDSAALWRQAIHDVGSSLPEDLQNPVFFQAEYAMVILPQRITTETGYLRVRRTGRGVALDRGRRTAVWQVVEAYRAAARAEESTDFEEKAAIATEWLRQERERTGRALFDHVVVDEGQDLTPSRLRLLRALVAEGRNDLFLCEDSHQRIYGHKVTLSQCGIRTVGRSRRLTLNYRTTEQNLRWAVGVLAGGNFTDLEGEGEEHEYRSARSGPRPVALPAVSAQDELDGVAGIIREWLREDSEAAGIAPEGVALMVPDKWERSRVVAGLQERGVETRAVDSEPVRPGAPVVMTMHRAKGLEFTHVVLVGIDPDRMGHDGDDEEAADAALRQRSLLYVAATRARDVLAMTMRS